jgi:hypothetical protein
LQGPLLIKESKEEFKQRLQHALVVAIDEAVARVSFNRAKRKEQEHRSIVISLLGREQQLLITAR